MLPPIDPAAHKNKQRNQKLYNKGKGTDNPNEADAFLRRTGPQLPLAAVGADQQPAQGPFTPIRNYPGMGYGPYGPGGGGLPPAPVRQANNAGFYMGPQAGQADQYPPMAAGFLNKYVS